MNLEQKRLDQSNQFEECFDWKLYGFAESPKTA